MIYTNAYYFIGGDGGCCFDSNKKYIYESNDWSYLIGGRRYSLPGTPVEDIDKDAVSFVTTFSTGLHAFVGVLSIINKYLRQKVSNKTVVISDDLQDGIIELLTVMIKPKEVIRIKKDQVYKFNSIQIISNSLHSYFENTATRDEIVETINEVIPEEGGVAGSKIALIKHPGSGVASRMGEITLEEAETFCSKHDYNRIEPSHIGEVGTINALRKAKRVVASWGTTFLKNFVYISEECEQIDVLIFGSNFVYEYNQCEARGILPKKYRNARIVYHLNPNLNMLQL